MNPFEYWFRENGKLVEALENYFVRDIEVLEGSPELRKDATALFKTGSSLEKTQVLTLLGAAQLLGVRSS